MAMSYITLGKKGSNLYAIEYGKAERIPWGGQLFESIL